MPSPVSLDKIKDVLRIQAGSSKVDVASSTRTLYVLLIELLKELRSSVPDGYNFSDFTALVEDIWQSKKVAFSVNVASMLAAVLKEGLHKIPGFVVRSLVTAAANCCNNKTSTPLARENALTFMTILIRDRISDCASQSMDVFQIASKLIKATEVGVRIQSVKTLQAIVLAGGGKLSDMYVEVMKVIQRAVLDKAETVRDLCIHTVRYLAEYSDGFSIVGADVLLSILVKPLEDESATVQASAAMAAATVYELQIRAFVDKQEQAKIGAARGSDNATKAKQPATTSRLSIAKFTSKKVVEEQHDLKTVVDNLIRIFYRSNDTLRSGYLLTLGFLLEYYLDSIDGEDLDWAVLTIMTIPQEPNFQQLSFEEQTSWRTKISAVLRRHIFANLPEQKLISVANALIKSCGGLESGSKSDLEMQIILEETNHVLNNLGAALVALRDEAITCATVNLRHSSFAVRVAAANILVTVSAAVPAVAVDFVRNALNNAKTQASQLASMDFTGEELATDEDSGTMTPSPRRKTAKEMEKLQRMYYFHGHAIVMAMILRNVVRIPDGLNYDEILQALDFGLSMMSNDLYAAPATSKNVLCSIIRAGALIVSSCISVGYEVSRLRLRQILDTCSKIFHLGEADPQVVKAEEMVYEVMCIESAVVCIYNLLQYSTESLALDGTCLITVIDHLEVCFRNLKNKYQPVYRAHFRFRTLHVILLESFALLPPGSYPNSCQQIYVEALRVYRDCISSGVECTSPLLDHLVKEGPRNTDIQLLWKDRIWSEAMVTLKLDSFVTVLQKRETEAFLTLFGQDFQPLFASDTFLYDARHGTTTVTAASTPAAVASAASREASNTFKSSLIETRCLDTAIKLMAVTFSHQSSEYQDKAIQLFAQAMAQVAPAPAARMSLTGSSKSLSLFGNDEERKRKERRMYLVHKDVVCALYAIVEAFPVHSGEVVELEYQWRESLVDQLYTFLTVKDDTLRFTAAISLAKFSMKWRGYNVISSVSQKIRAAIIPSLAKTTSGDTSQFMEDLSGYIPALGYLWSAASTLPDVRSLVTTTLFDCLRKADASIHFLSLVMAALACICDAQLAIGIEQMTTTSTTSTTETMAAEASDFLEKVVYVIESTQALVSNTDEDDMLVLECVALLGPALALALHCKASSELTVRLQTLLWSLPRERPHSGVKLQLAWYRAIQTVAMHDLDGTCLPLVLHALKATHIGEVAEEGEEQDRHQRILDTCLESIVGTVVALADHHPAVVVQELTVDVVIALFERVLNRACASSILDQRGVEIRQDTIDLTRSSTYRLLAQQLDGALQRVILAHIDEDVERHVTFWMLYLRSIALGLGKPNQTATRRGSMNGGGGGGGGDGGGGDRDDDGDDGGDDGAGSGAAGASGASSGSAGGMGGASGAAHGGDDAVREETVSLHSLTSISQLSTVYREHMLKRCPYLPYGRMEVKAAALRLATIIAKTYLPRIPAVSDMARARQIAMQDLQRMRATTPTLPVSQFLRLHMPITLYLNDLVNLGCSSATYTLNDKTVLSFQSSGMQFLAEICRWFAQAQDPDYQSQGDGAIDAIESQLLLQFLSQILGALRVCLSIRHAPSLMQDTSEILQLLLSQGFIRDKVALKRLLKPIGTYVEEAFGSGGAGRTVQGAVEAQVIRPVTGGVHESNATHEMLVMLRLLGQFRLLAYGNGNGNGNGVDAGVRATLATFVTEIGDVFYVIAQALITDAVRMFGIIGLPIQQIKDVHPLSGGLTYSPMVHILSYQRTYMDTALLLAQALTVTDLSSTSTTSASGNTATVDGLMEAIVLLVDAAMDASELPPAVLVQEDAAWLQTVHGQVAVIIAQLCSQRAVLTHPTRSLSLLTRLSVTGATVDVPLVTRIVVTLLQQQPPQAQPTTAAGIELLQVCWSRVLALTKTVVPAIFERATTDAEGEDAAAPLVSINTLLQRHWTTTTATTTATTTTVVMDDASIKETVVCWLVLASKLVASSTSTESLVYIARLLALLALEYARQHRLASTTTTTGSGALLETLVKAYGKVISLLASSVAVQGECSFLLGLVWQGYQTMVQPPALSSSNSSSVSDTTTTMTWEAWLETALMLWSTALSMATSLTEVAVPSELVAMWVSLHRLPTTVQSVSVGVATRLLQYVGSNSGTRGSLMLQQTLVPCLLAVYASEEDSEMRGLQLRFFLMAFTVATTTPAAVTATGSESRVALFLRAFVPTLCDSIARHITDAAYLLLTGRALTHIARVAAEDFKAVVATLSDGNRGTLQLAMRTALLQEQQQQQQLQQQQQQQQQQFASSGGTAAPGGGIKINMDRYRHT